MAVSGAVGGQATPSALGVRNFQLLWLGEAVSALGDQFAFVALPWLALILTGSALALGSVLALMAIPRGLFMLVGGAYVDRLSPRRVMALSNGVRLIAVAVIALIVIAGWAQLWMLYLFALVFGLADAFFYPAQQSIVPALLEPAQLGQGNAIVQGTGQLAVFVGPALAGVVVAALGTSGARPSTAGIGLALLVDAASFVVSLVSLALIHGGGDGQEAKEPILDAVRAGVRFVWNVPTLRLAILIVMGINMLVVGPLDVGLPVFAYARLPEGVTAYGMMMSASGGGALVGMLAGGLLPAPRASLFGPVVLTVLASAGLGVAALSFVSATLPAVAICGLIGIGVGYANLSFITWAQRRIPDALMGRVMSLLMLGSIALVPASQVVAGALVQVSLTGLLLVAGCLMAALTLGAAATPVMRRMGSEPAWES